VRVVDADVGEVNREHLVARHEGACEEEPDVVDYLLLLGLDLQAFDHAMASAAKRLLIRSRRLASYSGSS
jgi:hypothetical protein